MLVAPFFMCAIAFKLALVATATPVNEREALGLPVHDALERATQGPSKRIQLDAAQRGTQDDRRQLDIAERGFPEKRIQLDDAQRGAQDNSSTVTVTP
ncbi:hypothetical protein MVEN_00966400 [Mycena venus]|uniref:Secreted protein n=1 Tax=Mycena venus TaxID=2733690 RepID=A0A8H6YCR3_9AGAR|nr:hypothetical protein MVEN_00966400 [Mycena venus]